MKVILNLRILSQLRKYLLSLLIVIALLTPEANAQESCEGDTLGAYLSKVFEGFSEDEKATWLLEQSRTMFYQNPEIALKYSIRLYELVEELSSSHLQVLSSFNLARAYINLSRYPKAYKYILEGIAIAKQKNEKQLLGDGYRILGVWYDMQGDLVNALDNYHKSLAVYEELGDEQLMATCYNNIGIMHNELNNHDSAIEFYKKAIEIHEKMDNKRSLSKAYCNLGNVFQETGDFMSALTYLGKALSIDRMMEDKQGVAANLLNIGLVYFMMRDYDKALSNMNQSLELSKELKDTYRVIDRYSAISDVYDSLGDFKNGEFYAQEALDLSREIGSLRQQAYAVQQLVFSFSKQKLFEEAFTCQKELNLINDSLYSIDKEREIALINTKYQVEKQQEELQKAMLLSAKDRVIRNAFIAAFALSLFLIFIVFNSYRTKLVANRIINEKNVELEQANTEIIAQRDEVEAQRDMVISQKERLEEVHMHITNSLRYAQSIQAAILPPEKLLNEISANHFVLTKPCELVSGDFFWTTSFDDYHVFCIADCTGHGVPGAFMSILGVNALNDIVGRHRVTNPSEILGYLRESVIEALSQNDPDHLHKDGLDIALCVHNRKKHVLEFAGAGIPLWLIAKPNSRELSALSSSEPLAGGEYSLYEIKGNVFPVGFSPRMETFTLHSIPIPTRSLSVYLATDGFADQLGGEPKGKFGGQKLKSLVLQNSQIDFSTQKTKLNDAFESWKGIGFQVDDATILGVKIS